MPALDAERRRAKLTKLCEIEGFDDENALFAAAVSDRVCPAICCNPDNPDCDYTAEMEPDQDRGWCEVCGKGTLVSGLVLGGLISWRPHLMAGERFIYALADWTVERRERGWYFTRSANRHNAGDWQGPYRSEASVAMMIARQLRREIVERYRRQMNGRAP